MSFVSLTGKRLISNVDLSRSKWYKAALKVAPDAGVTSNNAHAWACIVVTAAINGRYMPKAPWGLTLPSALSYVLDWPHGDPNGTWDILPLTAQTRADALAALRRYVQRVRPATWDRWRAVADAQRAKYGPSLV
jgi:hypothetical protein